MKYAELVLLVESESWRPFAIDPTKHITTIIERMHLSPGQIQERVWICTNDERALTGQRIFREVVKPATEPAEKPVFDELVIKKPLPFTWHS